MQSLLWPIGFGLATFRVFKTQLVDDYFNWHLSLITHPLLNSAQRPSARCSHVDRRALGPADTVFWRCCPRIGGNANVPKWMPAIQRGALWWCLPSTDCAGHCRSKSNECWPSDAWNAGPFRLGWRCGASSSRESNSWFPNFIRMKWHYFLFKRILPFYSKRTSAFGSSKGLLKSEKELSVLPRYGVIESQYRA